MTENPKPVQLHIVHDLGGGIERWYRDYCEADDQRINLILKPFATDEAQYGGGLMLFDSREPDIPLRVTLFDSPFPVVVTTHPEYSAAFKSVLRDYQVQGIIVSTLIGHSLDVLDTDLPTLVVNHDFFPACPAINTYFNGPCDQCDDARVAVCKEHNPPAFNPFGSLSAETRIEVRRDYLQRLSVRRIPLISPTASTQSRWRRLFLFGNAIRNEIIPHGLADSYQPVVRDPDRQGERPRIVVLGAISATKGLTLLQEALPKLTEKAELVLLGAGAAGQYFAHAKHVSLIDSYRPEELPAIIERLQPDLGLLLSVWPETYSYTLSELSALGIPVMATRIGSFQERIKDDESGFLFSPNPEDLIKRVHEVTFHPDRLATVRENLRSLPRRSTTEMVADYHRLMPLSGSPEQSTKVPSFPDPRDAKINYQLARLSALRREIASLRQHVAISSGQQRAWTSQIEWLTKELVTREQRLVQQHDLLNQRDTQIADRDASLSLRDQQLLLRDQQLAARGAELAEIQRQLSVILDSTSWTITRPLRLIVRILRRDKAGLNAGIRHHVPQLGKWVYSRLPIRFRRPIVDAAYRLGGHLFRGLNDYERWRHARLGSTTGQLSASCRDMVHLDDVSPRAEESPGRIAIHAHIFYADLASEFADHFAQMPYAFDLFVSVPDETTRQHCEKAFKNLPRLDKMVITTVPNRGRDMAPMFCTFGDRLREYEYLAHVHGKKSLYNGGRTQGWREYLLAGLFGNANRIRRIFALLADAEPAVGMVYPQTFDEAPYLAHTWLANRETGLTWCRKLDIPAPPGYFDFPVGSMFWARVNALRPLFDAGIRIEDFPFEAGQTDGTLAHCLERLLGLVPARQGYDLAILADGATPSWSKWRMEKPLSRHFEGMVRQLTAPEIKVVVFDIFDTLLLRSLVDAEDIKRIVSRLAGETIGPRYLAERHAIESLARQETDKDVSLDDIYLTWARAGTFAREDLKHLRDLEERTELASVSPRPEAIELMERARRAGKRIVLASDMYLPRHIIEAMLSTHGIDCWHHLYLSNEINARKDDGRLYRHLLNNESAEPGAVIMVGDNERSDFQIPNDLGMRFCHLLRPVEIARALPRWHSLVDKIVGLDDSLGLGLILRHHFAPLSFPKLRADSFSQSAHEMGYAVVGPVTLAFAIWLGNRARLDGIEKLYFLSREGALLKRVYDKWIAAGGEGPDSAYLVLSRRSVTVPMIANQDDVFDLARARFFPNDPAMMLRERYGLSLDETRWEEIFRRGLWKRGQLLEIRGQDIDHIKPLLVHLLPDILRIAEDEKPALMAYLEDMDLLKDIPHALVDVGYSGTIQGRLHRLLGIPIDGYYMITTTAAHAMAQRHGIRTAGCYGDGLPLESRELGLYRQSFELEKLLSSDESQIVRYRIRETGDIEPEYRQNCVALQSAQGVRARIQAGIMAFLDDALAIKSGLVPDFTFSTELAASLFDAQIKNMSPTENAILQEIILDDYYCGRGLVQ